ncbi:MAG: glycoside hydrolase family 9 protein [Haloarculaceae archaeon]
MQLFVNHRGYETGGPKRAVLRGTERVEVEGVRAVDAAGATVRETDAEYVGGVDNWGDGEWVFWTVEFSALSAPGEYHLLADAGGETVRSRPFEVGDRLLQEQLLSDLLFFFKSQRSSGVYDRADRAVPFVGDREGTADVHGGWYDASGDMSKYLSHLSYANYLNPQHIPMAVWGLADAREQLAGHDRDLGAQLDERLVEEIVHGADFLVRMLDGEGYFYTTVFDQWSHDTDRREICSYEGEDGTKTDDYEAAYREGGGVAIAALARASAVDGPAEYDPDTYLESAVTAFDHLEEHNEAYLYDGTENVIDDYCALLAATELAAATGEERFREAADERAESLLARQTGDDSYEGWFRADDDGERPFFHAAEEGLPVVALLRYRDVVGGDSAVAEADESVADAVARYWDFETAITDDVTNPFGYARQYVKAVDEDEPRDSFFIPHENESGYWWQGENARLASLAAAASRSQEVVDDDTADRLERFARDQLDWILGRNPFDVAMMRGVGPQGPEYHVAYRNAPGGVMNGITAGVEDESDIAFCPDPQGEDHAHRWRWAEQWLPHAVWLFVALASAERV